MSLPYFFSTSRFVWGSFVVLLALTILFNPAVASSVQSRDSKGFNQEIEEKCKIADKNGIINRYSLAQVHQQPTWVSCHVASLLQSQALVR